MQKPLLLAPMEVICGQNREFTGMEPDQARQNAAASCYASLAYYETPQEQIASVVSTLLKSHFFVDGNKRTALYTYLLLSELNQIGHIEDDAQLVTAMLSLAASPKDVAEAVKTLFPDTV